jgi:subtilisin family serine protease
MARATYLYHELAAHALRSQADLRAWLDLQGIPYRAHYIINMISLTGDAAFVDVLRQRPDVARIDANPQIDSMHINTLNSTISNSVFNEAALTGTWARTLQLPEAETSPNVPYGLSATRAPEVWALGYTGEGITVASQDTGVEWDHPALRPHYRGVNGEVNGEVVEHTYNWLDAIPESGTVDGCEGMVAPCDDNGHGTHTVGTMVGATAETTLETSGVITYGIAPAAQWMGCRNMRKGVGTPESYTTCFEFFLAPYPPGGDPLTQGRPELAPHIINNSWGCPPSEGCNKDSLRQVVETVRAAGIMVVASAGNVGFSGCSSVVDPIAIYDATFTVGAHDSAGNLAGFSSRGPVMADGSGRLKPELTAPGVGVLSTYRFSGTTSLSGTSMASPHVAGAVALVWSAAPWLIGDPDLTEQVLLKSATPVYSDLCNTGTGDVSPNPAFGYGRLDVAAAVEMALQPWEVTVSVTDGVGAPVAGAALTWIDGRTAYSYTATTNESGSALTTPMLAGQYTLQVQGSAGVVEVDNIVLEVGELGSDPRTKHFNVLYDPALVPYPARHFMPGIYFRYSQ